MPAMRICMTHTHIFHLTKLFPTNNYSVENAKCLYLCRLLSKYNTQQEAMLYSKERQRKRFSLSFADNYISFFCEIVCDEVSKKNDSAIVTLKEKNCAIHIFNGAENSTLLALDENVIENNAF